VRSWTIALVLAVPALGRALEPRFDHRDQQGIVAELGYTRDSATTGNGIAVTTLRPVLHLAYSLDIFDGNELLLGGGMRLGDFGDHRAETVRATIDARYRGYFGADELKTFFEVGLMAPLSPSLALGPMAAIGAAYDFSRSGGLFASFGFATGLGQIRLASFQLAVGGQIRW
jgi:hypothetical protein